MNVDEAQRDVRSTFVGGSIGQLVSGLLWGVSAALATWGAPRQAITFLVVGGFFILPTTQLCLRMLGRPASLRREHPLGHLAMQVAFVLPLSLPVVGAAALHKIEWLQPAFMVVLGAHYLPSVFPYGMRMFALLCASLVGGGVAIGLYWRGAFGFGAWVTAGLLLLCALLGYLHVRGELRQP